MKPATYSTPEPPESLKSDPEAMEYAQALRRRVEVQNAQLEALTEQLRKAQEDLTVAGKDGLELLILRTRHSALWEAHRTLQQAHRLLLETHRTLQRNTIQPHMEPPP